MYLWYFNFFVLLNSQTLTLLTPIFDPSVMLLGRLDGVVVSVLAFQSPRTILKYHYRISNRNSIFCFQICGHVILLIRQMFNIFINIESLVTR
jgi:hypothetical protein